MRMGITMRMKLKLWGWVPLLLFGMSVSVSSSAMATDAGDIINSYTPEATANLAVQEEIVQILATQGGGNFEDYRLSLIDSSDGQFIPEVTRAVQSQNFDPLSKFTLNTLFRGGVNGSSPSSEVIAGLNTVNGVASLAGATTGLMAVDAIGNSVFSRQETVLDQQRDMASKFGSNSGLASAAMNSDFANRIWASPFYTRQKGDQNELTEEYKYEAKGISLGFDRAFGSFTAGVAFTYSDADYEVKNVIDDNSIKNYGVSGYGQYYNACNGLFFTVAGGYNYSDNEWNRFIQAGVNLWDVGENNTKSYWAGGNIGKDFAFGEKGSSLYLTPSVGLFWSEANSSEYEAFGTVNRHVGKVTQKSLVMPVEVATRYVHELSDDSSVTFKAQGGYSYNFKNDGPTGSVQYNYLGAQEFAVTGTAPGRHGWNAGGGIQYKYKNMDLGVDYRYDRKKKVDAHRVSATVGVSF